MKRCGDHQWWVEGSRLTVRRERGPFRWVLAAVCLALALGAVHLLRTGLEDSLGAVVLLVVFLALGIDQALGVRQVTLDQGSPGRVVWTWGLGVPLLRTQRQLDASDRVQFRSASGHERRGTAYEVRLEGQGEAVSVATTDDEDEALALAQAAAHHAGLGLGLDGGRDRHQPEPEVQRGPPPGCRVHAREEGGRLVLSLPGLGWRGVANAMTGSIGMLLLGLGSGGYLLWNWKTFSAAPIVLLFPLLTGGSGVLFLRRTLRSVTFAWSLTASRQGLELLRLGWKTTSRTRIAAHLLRDLDVRDLVEGDPQVRSRDARPIPLLVIARENAEQLALGAGLSRPDLEWAASRLRQALAEDGRRESRSVA